LHDWTPHRRPGHWPDADMLPLGNIRTMEADSWTRFTTNEQRTLMTMWCMARSPLMMGGHLPRNDAFTLSLLTNREVLAVNQASLNNRQLFRRDDAIAWAADVPGSAEKYLGLINANDFIFDPESVVFDSGIIRRSTPGAATNIVANITGAKRLYLITTDADDGMSWDHADWGMARITKPDGTVQKLADLEWVDATSGWKPQPLRNQSIDRNPLRIKGVTMEHGIGTHAPSVIEFDLPPGFTEFQAVAGLDDEIYPGVSNTARSATVRFMISTNPPAGRRIEVAFSSLSINEPVRIRDLWTQRDLGIYTNSFQQTLPRHASALFKLTPVGPAGTRD
jgi:alpha-galactosidase